MNVSILLSPIADLQLNQHAETESQQQLSRDGRLLCTLNNGNLQTSLLQPVADKQLRSVPIALASDAAPVHVFALLDDDHGTAPSPAMHASPGPAMGALVPAQYIVAATAHSMCVHVLQLPSVEAHPLTCRYARLASTQQHCASSLYSHRTSHSTVRFQLQHPAQCMPGLGVAFPFRKGWSFRIAQHLQRRVDGPTEGLPDPRVRHLLVCMFLCMYVAIV